MGEFDISNLNSLHVAVEFSIEKKNSPNICAGIHQPTFLKIIYVFNFNQITLKKLNHKYI